MSWKLSPALVTLRNEINKAYPGRSKISDGSIGDTSHQARKTDHNPDKDGWVRAIDVTEWDPYTPTIDADDVAEALAEFLRASKDSRIKYVIWRGRMFSSYATSNCKPWTWRKYTGANGHFKHCHVSVQPGVVGLAIRAWGFVKPGKSPSKSIGGFAKGAVGSHVEFLQAMLNILWRERITTKGTHGGAQVEDDGRYGDMTVEAVREIQRFLRVMGQLAGHKTADLIEVTGKADDRTLAQIGWWVTQVLKKK